MEQFGYINGQLKRQKLIDLALLRYGSVMLSHRRVKVARYSFSGSIVIPTKFEHKLRRHKQSFGKIATTVVLDEDGNCYDQGCNGIGVVIATK